MTSNPLRVVICSSHFYPDHPNGADRLAFDEAVFLANRNHEVWLVAQDISRSKPEHSFQENLHVLRYPSPQLGSFDFRRTRIHQEYTRDVLRRHLGDTADIVHGHSLLNYDGALSLFGTGVRKCFSIHSPVYLETRAANRKVEGWRLLQTIAAANLLHRIEHRCLLQSDTITVFSNYTKSLIRELHGIDIAKQTLVIPGWVDLDRFRILTDRETMKGKLGWPLDTPVLFTLRRLVPRMGLDRLLYAVQKVRSSGRRFCLVIGGTGPLRIELETLARTLNLEQVVRFIGFVPDAELPMMYAATDVFVLPTAELECFGIIALEALACGRPVLATPVGAIPELIERVEPAWLARDASSEAIAQLLSAFLDGVLPERTPESLRQSVAQAYSKDLVLETMLTTLTQELTA
jgi:glycosyltransferase involved in cell wall biosynthesis